MAASSGSKWTQLFGPPRSALVRVEIRTERDARWAMVAPTSLRTQRFNTNDIDAGVSDPVDKRGAMNAAPGGGRSRPLLYQGVEPLLTDGGRGRRRPANAAMPQAN